MTINHDNLVTAAETFDGSGDIPLLIKRDDRGRDAHDQVRTGDTQNESTKITTASTASCARPEPSGVLSYSRGCFIPKKKISTAQKIQLQVSEKYPSGNNASTNNLVRNLW